MKQLRYASHLGLAASATSLILAISAVAGAPLVQAASSSDGSSSSTSTSVSSDDSGPDGSTSSSGSGSQQSGPSDDNRMGRHPLEQADDRMAKDPQTQQQRLSDAQEKLTQAKQDAQQRLQTAEAKGGLKLDAAKLKVCENRADRIGTIMGRVGQRGEDHVALIGTIQSRLQQFVTDKKLTVANYDALVAAANSAKTTAQSAADAVNSAKAGFKCDGADPAGAASSFGTLVSARSDAVNVYRDAVKSLLRAVKTALQASQKAAASSTSDGGVQ